MELIRQKAAQFLGAFPDEIAILRNATEYNKGVWPAFFFPFPLDPHVT